mmetsp:Transcript_108945/g.308092  ORF Transcript_108945/g.308092 Transcript_108945/m.308092 type:complete len:280 (-) Transcript_108945:1746-2585(-)
MEAVPNSRPQMWQTTVLGRAALGNWPPAGAGLGADGPELGPSAATASASRAFALPLRHCTRAGDLGRQLRRCTSSRSGRKVRPQCGHAFSTSWFQCSSSLSLACSRLSPGSSSGLAGTGRRWAAGFCASAASHFFSHCGRWMSMEAVPNSRPHMWQTTVFGRAGGLPGPCDETRRGALAGRALRGGSLRSGVPQLCWRDWAEAVGRQLRKCTSSRSGRNVRPQCGQGSSTWSFQCRSTASLACCALRPASSCGFSGTGRRWSAGFCASRASHRFAHWGT